jgi:uncharacterized membrane protein (DUF2068 family)
LNSRERDSRSRSEGRLLPWIAGERTLRAVVLIALGTVLVTHTHTDWGRPIADVAKALGLDPSRNGIRRITTAAHELNAHKLLIYGIVALGYGALEAVEGYGLLRRRRWAEYLTIFATSLLFIPEIWELTKKLTPLKVAGFILNALIVAYLVHRVRRRQSSETDERPARRPTSSFAPLTRG